MVSVLSAERRSHPRLAVLSSAMVVGESGISGHCLVEDLSSGGARLSNAPLLVVGEVVRLLLQLPGHSPLSVGATVVRRLTPGSDAPGHRFALSFSRAAARAAHHLHEVVWALQQMPLAPQGAVLVVDASTHTCLSMAQDLARVGRRAIAVTTPLDAVEWLLAGAAHFDAAIVDASLSHSSGCDLLSFLAEEYPNMRRIILGDERGDAVSGHLVLPKPWEPEALRAALAAAK